MESNPVVFGGNQHGIECHRATNRGQILEHVVAHVGARERGGYHRQAAQEQSVSISLRCDRGLGANVTACTGPVFDHDRATKIFAHLFPDQSGGDVVGPASRERNNELYRSCGKRVLSHCGGRHNERDQQDDRRCRCNGGYAAPPKLECNHFVLPSIIVVSTARDQEAAGGRAASFPSWAAYY